jgi:hypothetical protein
MGKVHAWYEPHFVVHVFDWIAYYPIQGNHFAVDTWG